MPSIVVPGTHAGSAREAWGMAWPTIVSNLAVTFMWAADTIMLGWVGKVELAAAGLSGVLIFTLYTFFIGMVTAVNTFVSQSDGADRPEDCAVYTAQGLWFCLAGAVFLGIVAWRFDLLMLIAAPAADVAAESIRYGQARMAGAFFVLGTFTLQSFFRGIGDVKTPMRVAIAANVLNIAFDALLIFGLGPIPRLTTLGAGLATTLANAVGFTILLVCYTRPHLARAYGTLRRWRYEAQPMRRLFRVGAPMGVQFFGDMGSFSVFMAIMGRLGTNQLAASQIGIQVLSFSFMPASAIGRAATTLVGQYIGAGQPELANRCGWTVLKMNVGYALVVAALILLAQEHLFRVFNRDPGVLAAGLLILPLLALFQLGDAVQMAAAGALQGAGDTMFPMAAVLVSSWALFVPGALLLSGPAGMGMQGAWIAGVVHLGIVALVLTARFRAGAWQRKRVV